MQLGLFWFFLTGALCSEAPEGAGEVKKTPKITFSHGFVPASEELPIKEQVP